MTPVTHATRSVAEQITSICGPASVSISDGQVSVTPASTLELASVLRFANSNGLSVAPRGSGSKTSWLDTDRTDILLLTGRMAAVLEHTWQDMTCTVEAGCPWLSMQSALAQHGQFVALDPLWPAVATVGGIVATNDSGALRLRYGGLRDLILGVTVVLSDGTVARSGGKVVKNVAGYDLPKLMCGAFGTLGVLTELTFRLHAIPRSTAGVTVSSPTPEPLGTLLLQILDSHASAQSLQLRTTGEGFALDVQLATLRDVLASQVESLHLSARQMHLPARSSDPGIWSARQREFNAPAAFRFKATMLPTEIARVSGAVFSMGGTAVTQATGIMVGSVPSPDRAAGILDLRTSLESLGGSLTLLASPPGIAIDRWSSPPAALSLMREVKRQFDPRATLNPGRFFGGL